MKRRFLIALILLLLLSTYNIQNSLNLGSKFKIKKIVIENNNIVKEEKIKKKLHFLYDKNLFFLNLKSIEAELNEIDFIESFILKKIYPHKIEIKIFEKEPIAILQNKKAKKYYTKNNGVINFINLEKYENLPLVFGDQKSFKIFYENLKSIGFPIGEIKTFFLFESRRWDIITIKDQTIKLPSKNYDRSLKNFIDLKNQGNFEKYKIFDYRISDQLILK